jgi:hypothetical protein
VSHPSIRTRSITFRLDPNTVDNLQREADQKEISLNVLVNQVLRRYVKWDTFEPKIGMMPVPKIILSTCFNKAILAANEAGLLRVAVYTAVLCSYNGLLVILVAAWKYISIHMNQTTNQIYGKVPERVFQYYFDYDFLKAIMFSLYCIAP